MANSTYMNPSGIADPSPSGFTAVVKAGNTVYIAGMVAQDENGNVVGAGDTEAQTRQIWRNIEVAVKAAGGTLADIVKTTTYVTGIEHGPAVRAVRGELFPSNPPTSTLLVVSELANPAYVVEIESIAVVA
ncbi:Putative aminoacrylate peracid reductase RutC [Geodia barretti]|jgi:enamine deaminase RidA (YjgF/YER057c/UK114 family)|uniref:Aminoacrylate peracid reductase RutC n=1 Tax=Geodia barretti TaxID=519541 RepID=A0AA35TT09_GEOBA|nr:Putative aminoacrylate peracid reductase RutC [Geodia barretti]